jgi:pimeloyl-ACP methyl ester carboxylesterase
MVWGFFLGHVLPTLFIPQRARVGQFIRYVSATPDAAIVFKELVEQIYLGAKHIGLPRTVKPCVFRDDELRRIAAPTLLLIGDSEVIYDPQAALERAARLIPHIETGLIPGAGHDLMRDQPALVNGRILAFFSKDCDATVLERGDRAQVAAGI